MNPKGFVLPHKTKKPIDITDQTFGLLTAKKIVGTHSDSHGAIWLCECECGNTCERLGSMLRTGRAKNCGRERHPIGKSIITHCGGQKGRRLRGGKEVATATPLLPAASTINNFLYSYRVNNDKA